MIELTNVQKAFSKKFKLDIPELKFCLGDFSLLIGRNGSGKTTLFKLMTDLIIPDHGRIQSFGKDIRRDETWKTYTGVYLGEGFLIPYLTPWEHFKLILECRGRNPVKIDDQLKPYEFFLADVISENGVLIRELSKGNQQKVGIVSALLGNPRVIFLDEPFSSLDPTSQDEFSRMISSYHQSNECLIVLSSHNLLHLHQLGNKTILLNGGKIADDVASGESRVSCSN